MEDLIKRVGIPMFVQLAIESWNEILLLILILTILVGQKMDKSNRMFDNLKIPMTGELTVFYVAALIYNFCDVFGNAFLDTTMEFSHYVVRLSIFLYYVVGFFQTLLFLQVMRKYVAEKNGQQPLKKALLVFQALQFLNLLILFINPFTHILYRIDGSNHYHRSWGIYLWQGITIISFLFIAAIVIVQWKKIDKFIRHIIITAVIFPFFALIGTFFVSGISLNNIAVTISALMSYMIYERNRTMLTVKNAHELEDARIQLMEKQLVIEQNKQELQENKIRLLVAQIQPHFIFNSLMALQSRSTDNPELYNGIRSFGKYLRASFEAMTEDTMIPFEEEMKSIRAYIQLERMNYGDKLRVEYDIEIDRFMLPALSVEPLVENAIRYGVGTYEKGGLVRISVLDEPDCILIEVWDDGSGGNKLTDAQKGRKSIGIENVRLRLKAMDMGELTITQDETGTSAVIRLKYEEGQSENDND